MVNKQIRRLPRGVTVRTNKLSQSIQASFYFQGKKLRKNYPISPTNKNIEYVARERGEFLNQIERNIFDYDKFRGIQNDYFIKDLLSDYKIKAEKTYTASTYNGYRKAANILIKALGELKVTNLNHTDIKKFILSQNCSMKRISNLLIPLKSILTDMIDEQVIIKNPFNTIILKKIVPVNKQTTQYEIDPFNFNEMQKILTTAKGAEKNMFQFAFWSGVRTGELIAMRWIDIHGLYLNIKRSVTEGEEGTPKTTAGRRKIKLLKLAYQALENQRKITGDREFVFYHPTTDMPFCDDQQIRVSIWTPLYT